MKEYFKRITLDVSKVSGSFLQAPSFKKVVCIKGSHIGKNSLQQERNEKSKLAKKLCTVSIHKIEMLFQFKHCFHLSFYK